MSEGAAAYYAGLFEKLLASDVFAEYLAKAGASPNPQFGADFGKFNEEQTKLFTDFFTESGELPL